MTPTAYKKPHLSVADQIVLLKKRGLAISDDDSAGGVLQRLGYYRLSGYWYPMRQTIVRADSKGLINEVQETFRPGAELRHAADLYVFDKKLRLLISDAIERIEVGLRVDVAHLLGARDPWAHLDPAQLHGNFSTKTDAVTGLTRHQTWIARLQEIEARSKEDYVKHFRKTYASPLPIWISIELWDFGALSMFIEGLKVADKEALAERYGLPKSRWDLIPSWARALNHIRNICAHHSRLWNRSPADQPKLPKAGEVTLLDHIDTYAATRLYAPLAACQYLLKTLNPNSAWGDRLKALAATFPTAPGLAFNATGFPADWADQPLWARLSKELPEPETAEDAESTDIEATPAANSPADTSA